MNLELEPSMDESTFDFRDEVEATPAQPQATPGQPQDDDEDLHPEPALKARVDRYIQARVAELVE